MFTHTRKLQTRNKKPLLRERYTQIFQSVAKLRCSLVMKTILSLTYPDAGYVVSPRVVVCAGGRAFDRSTHAVPIVLADEYDRKIPQFGDVVRLEYLSLIGCSVSIESNTDVVFPLVFHGQGDSCSERHL